MVRTHSFFQNPMGKLEFDPTILNESILREVLPSVDYKLAKFDGANIFSKMDANSAFWQRKLSKFRLLTKFITPWGRFSFNHFPYSILTGSEDFSKMYQ